MPTPIHDQPTLDRTRDLIAQHGRIDRVRQPALNAYIARKLACSDTEAQDLVLAATGKPPRRVAFNARPEPAEPTRKPAKEAP